MKKNPIYFFLDDLHQGPFNHLCHFLGFLILGLGLAKSNIFLVVISIFIMEAGHLLDFPKGVNRGMALTVIPFQLAFWGIFVAIGFFLLKFLI